MSFRSRGKRRAISAEVENSGSSIRLVSPNESGETLDEEPVGRRVRLKKAITRECPVCSEQIPIRLLASHLELERSRVEEIIASIGKRNFDPDVLQAMLAEQQADSEVGTSRKAALKARRSLTTRNDASSSTSSGSRLTPSSLSFAQPSRSELDASNAIKEVVRNRKVRLSKLRDLAKDFSDEASPVSRNQVGGNQRCPVCSQEVLGSSDESVMVAHVDACILEAANTAEQSRLWNESQLGIGGEYEVGGERRLRVTDLAGFRGTGFDVRNTSHVDIEEDVDIDGADEAVYGEAQFTERDIIAGNSNSGEEIEVDIEDADDLRNLVAGPSKPETRISQNVANDTRARGAGNMQVTQATSGKRSLNIASSAPNLSYTCKICLDAYTEPTVSTGCWHTCCRECWLRCLGSTKLCPICKRITGVSELRRIYL